MSFLKYYKNYKKVGKFNKFRQNLSEIRSIIHLKILYVELDNDEGEIFFKIK